MTTNEFLLIARKHIYKDAIIGVNKLLGVSKTAQAAIGMMVNVPIKVELRRLQETPKISKKFKSLARVCSAYLKHDTQEVVIAFFYTNDKELAKIAKSIEANSYYFTYLYMRELLMLSRGYNTHVFYKKACTKMGSVPTERRQAVMNIACYISISGILETIYKVTNKSKEFKKIAKFQAYDPSIQKKDFYTILEFVIADTIGFVSLDSNSSEIELSGGVMDITHFTNYALVNDKYDAITTDLGETVEATLAQATRGTNTAEIFKTEFEANTRSNTGWFKKLTKTLSRIVYYQTNDFTSSWGGLNSTYRRKFKSPKHEYSSTGINLVLSIDQSGSMSTEELSKVAGLLVNQSKRIDTLTVLIHDTEITKVFNLDAKELDTDSESFKKALLTRYQAGGTSHYSVFSFLNDIKDKSKLTYIGYSDNYSDIPEAYKKFPALAKAEMIFLCTIDNPVDIPGTTDITLE